MLNLSHSSNFNSHYVVGWLAFNIILNLRSGTKNLVIFGNIFDIYNIYIFSYCMNFIVTKEATDQTKQSEMIKEVNFMNSNPQQVL